MSVEYGFYKVSKFGDTSLEEFMQIEEYIRWKENPWNVEHYPTYKKYWDSFSRRDAKFPGEPDPSKVEYYSTHKEDDDGYEIAKCIGFWGFIGADLDKQIKEWLGMSDYESYKLINKPFIEKALIYVEKQLDLNRLVPMTVISDIGKVTLESDFGDRVELPLTGKRIYLESSKYDQDERYMLKLFRDTLYEIKNLDFDNNLIWYYRSW